jgi:hypothetical protein
MAYLIYKSDGTAISIPDNSIDIAYFNPSGGGGFGPGNVPQAGHGLGIELVGRNTVNYGAAIAQNFLQLQENFSSSVVPSDLTSLQGQLWFNQLSTTTGNLYVRITTNNAGGIANWQQVITADSGGSSTIGANLTVTGTITAEGGQHVPVVFTVLPGLGVAQNGDILVVGTVISIYAGGAWQQVFPAVYS